MNRITAALLAGLLALTALTGCESGRQRHERLSAECVADGNVVTGPEREWDSSLSRYVQEYECETPGGRELSDWNWDGK